MALSDDQQDGIAYLTDLLNSYGLGSLVGWAKDQVIAGHSPLMVSQMIQDTPEFKARFKVIFDRRAKGLSPMSVQDVINYEHQARQLFQSAGLPPGFYDSPDDFYNFMDNDVSINELAARVDIAKTIVYNTDPQVRTQMKSLFGINDGNEIAYVLDNNRALPLIQQQFLAAQDAAASIKSGYGQLTAEEAISLAKQSISPQQAQTGFATLYGDRQLFQPLPGQENSEATITRQSQLGAAFGGDATAQEAIRRQQELRVAQGKSGGSFTSNAGGFTGLGTSNT